jgi:hypothetical protein
VSDAPALKVGSPVWVRSEDYRGRDKRDAWHQREITGETRVSWLVGPKWQEMKLPKRDPRGFTRCDFGPRHVALSWDEVEDHLFVEAHRYRIAQVVERLAQPALLREIAKLVGYEAKP